MMKKELDAKCLVNLAELSRMKLDHRIEYLRMASIFGIIPPDKEKVAKSYIEQATAHVGNVDNMKPVVIKGGITQVADIIRQNFPCVVQLMHSFANSNDVRDFIQKHQIDKNDYVLCGGIDPYSSELSFICFKSSSDAILAKMYFESAIMLDKITDADLAAAEIEMDNIPTDTIGVVNGYASAYNGDTDADPNEDSPSDYFDFADEVKSEG